MKKHLVVIAVALAGLLAMTHSAFALPTGFLASTRIASTNHSSSEAGPLTKRYSALWHACSDKASCNPGRNIRRNGVKTKDGTRSARRVDYRASTGTLDRWLHPAAAPPRSVPLSTPAQVTIASGATPASSSGGMPRCTWEPESGGSYTASNPSGAYGKYQIMPVHYGGNGVCAGMGKSPSEQEVCARRVFASSGSGAWVNC